MEPAKSLNVFLESHGERWPNVGVRRLRGQEAISELFSFTLDVAIPATEDLAERAFPGGSIEIVIERDGLEVRRIFGMVARVVDRFEDTGDYRTYALHVVPHAHQLSLVETQEVYLNLTVPEVLKQKLEIHGLGKDEFELRLTGDYPKREIVVQHGESDLAFFRRLTEHLGISFFFEHTGTTDKLVLTDHSSGFGAIEGSEEVHFHARGEAVGVFALSVTNDLIPGVFFVQDYNYRAPLLDPTGQFSIDENAPGGIVEYGSHVKTPEEARVLAKIRAEERLARKLVYEGKSSLAELTAGKVIKLLDHPRLASGERLLLIEVEHDATFSLFGEAGAGDSSYQVSFRAIPADVVHRPRRLTPKPRLPGLVTGVIQPGPGGEVGGVAKLTDDGRYHVQLHFDTAERGQQRASHPVRMAQPFAGRGNGMHFPLLPGTEVIVAFANGDPDRPVIVGAMPNPVSPAPVVAENAMTHRIQTSHGVTFEFGGTAPGRR